MIWRQRYVNMQIWKVHVFHAVCSLRFNAMWFPCHVLNMWKKISYHVMIQRVLACHAVSFFISWLHAKKSPPWFSTAVAQTRLWNRVFSQPASQIFSLSLHAICCVFLLQRMLALTLQCCGSGLAQAYLRSDLHAMQYKVGVGTHFRSCMVILVW